MASEPRLPSGKRPNRTAKARREQQLRSDARSIAKILKGLRSISGHRGCQLSKAGHALKQALMSTDETESPQSQIRQRQQNKEHMPVCRHCRSGRCTWGDACRFKHADIASSDHRNCAEDDICIEELSFSPRSHDRDGHTGSEAGGTEAADSHKDATDYHSEAKDDEHDNAAHHDENSGRSGAAQSSHFRDGHTGSDADGGIAHIDDFIAKWKLDGECAQLLKEQPTATTQKIIESFRPRASTRSNKGLSLGYLGSLQREQRRSSDTSTAAATPSHYRDGHIGSEAGGRLAHIDEFVAKWRLDGRCAQQLKEQPQAMTRRIIEGFRPKASTVSNIGLFWGYLSSLQKVNTRNDTFAEFQ